MADNRNLVAAAMLVLSGAAYNVSSGPPATPGPGASGVANAALTATSHLNDLAPWDTYWKFARERKVEGRGVRFLLATLPDPVDTHLAIDFDRGIESVQNAASTAGYSFDRYWIPWRENTYAPTDDPAIREKQETERRERESNPGLLLFRGADNRPDLVVLLIGETPTAGINASQFTAAMKFIGERKADPAPYRKIEGDQIPLTGPSFSGSLPSLASAINRANTATRTNSFRVVSGSTTNASQEREFQGTAGIGLFHATLHSDSEATCAFLKWVGEESREDVKVGVLSEGDTAFGEGFREDKSENKSGCGVSKVTLLNFPFPRDIARLRNAYHEDSFAATLPDKYKTIAPEGVRLTLKDSNTGHDSVPSFSHEHTPISQDATLLSLVVALRRNEVKYVGIAATDPLDTYFLAQFLATNTPDVRMYQLDADLMFVRRPEGLPLAGMLSVTTYPMFAQNQYWTNPRRTWRVFSSRYSQGVYNAALSLLRDTNRKDEALLEYSSPFSPGEEGGLPPLWLVAAGRNGYWPVGILKPPLHSLMLPPDKVDGQSGQASSKQPAEPSAGEPPHLFTGSIWAFTLLLVWSVVEPLKARREQSLPAELRTVPSNSEPKVVFGRANLILINILSVAAATLCLMGPQWRLMKASGEWEDLIPGVLFVAAFATAVGLLWPQLLKGDGKSKIATGLCTAGFVTFLVWGTYLLAMDDHHQGFFSAYRSIHLSSGLAPNLPLILIFCAFFVWGRVHLQRRILIEERCQPLPKIRLRKDGAVCELCESAAKAVTNALNRVGDLRMLGIGGLIAAVVFSIALDHLQILEPQPYAWFYVLAIALLYGLLTVTTLQVVQVWTKLELVLDVMESHPIRFALSDLPQDRTWSPIWQSNVRKRSHVLLTRGVECLKALRQRSPDLFSEPNWLGDRLNKLEYATADVLKRVALGLNESEAQSNATALSHEIADALAKELEESYWRLGSAESPSLKLPDSSDSQADKWDRLKAEFVALRLLAYIRYVMLHLRNLLGFMTTGFVLALVSLESYPFQAAHIIMSLTTALFTAVGGTAVWMFYRMSRNLTLRRITSNDQSKSDWSYLVQLAETGALPVLALVATNFPGAGNFLFSWLGPILDKLH